MLSVLLLAGSITVVIECADTGEEKVNLEPIAALTVKNEILSLISDRRARGMEQ